MGCNLSYIGEHYARLELRKNLRTTKLPADHKERLTRAWYAQKLFDFSRFPSNFHALLWRHISNHRSQKGRHGRLAWCGHKG